MSKLSRRRLLTIGAAAAAFFALPATSGASAKPIRWRGAALGAQATILLHHPDAAFAHEIIDRSVAEIERLEQVFSLYRADSALSQLNRTGMLRRPPTDLVRLLSEAQTFGARTRGAFDVTVQPLWDLYARHFGMPSADPRGPGRTEIEAATALVDHRAVSVQPDAITLGRPGMAVTLNGIAQGYITDRVADLLRDAGFAHVLIDLGETKALGPQPDGTPWRVGIADPAEPADLIRTLNLTKGAVATSAPAGTMFDATGRHHHLFDPRHGVSNHSYRSVTVRDASATTADALSTAIAVAPVSQTQLLIDAVRPDQAVLVDAGGHVTTAVPEKNSAKP